MLNLEGKVDTNKIVESYKELDFNKNDTPIHIASMNGHLPIVQYFFLFKKGIGKRTPLN